MALEEDVIERIKTVKVVPGEGLEPSRSCDHKILSLACIPFHHPGGMEARMGVEPIWYGFANRCVTVPPPCH